MKIKLKSIFTLFILCFLAFTLKAQSTSKQETHKAPARPIGMQPVVKSPEILPDHTVIFRLLSREAVSVAVSGDWMPGWGTSVPMVKNDTGLWSLTVGPLSPELDSYTFLIDGVRVLDPNNPQVKRDGIRNESMLLIPGMESDLYFVKDVPHGRLTRLWYESPALKLNRSRMRNLKRSATVDINYTGLHAVKTISFTSPSLTLGPNLISTISIIPTAKARVDIPGQTGASIYRSLLLCFSNKNS